MTGMEAGRALTDQSLHAPLLAHPWKEKNHDHRNRSEPEPAPPLGAVPAHPGRVGRRREPAVPQPLSTGGPVVPHTEADELIVIHDDGTTTKYERVSYAPHRGGRGITVYRDGGEVEHTDVHTTEARRRHR